MAQRKKAGKLTGTAAGSVAKAPALPAEVDFGEFPDAVRLINSLGAEGAEGIEFDIRVYDATGAGGRGNTVKARYLYAITPEDMPTLEARLSHEFPGGGDFRVQVRVNGELRKNVQVPIAARPGYKPPPPSWMNPVAQTETAAPPATGADQIFLRLADMQEKSEARMLALIQAMGARNEVKPPSITEQLQLFQEFQKLIPQGQQSNSLEMFNKGMDMALKMLELRGDSGGGGTTVMDILKEAMNSPMIKDVLTGAVRAAGAAHQANGAPPAPALAPPSFFDAANPQAAALVDTLYKQAAAGVDPKTVATMITDHAPAEVLSELEQQEDIAAYVLTKFPIFAPYRDWVARVVAEIWVDENNAAAQTPVFDASQQQQPDAVPGANP